MALLKKPKDAVLVLEDGKEFWGWSVGANQTGFGEVIFNTAHCGYQEVLTDPSYYLQLVVMTYPHQGNYGITEADNESLEGPRVAGFIMHEICETPSNFESTQSLPDYLKKNKIPALSGIDTRILTLHIRSKGALRGFILSAEEFKKFDLKTFDKQMKFENQDLISKVTTKKPYWFSQEGKKTVVAVDFGIKQNLLRNLKERDCKVLVVPATTTAQEILNQNPDGVFLSNGPGDPQAATYAIETVKNLLGKKPIFGVCMGHQILALALGAKTYKMKFGHRGVNQPVLNMIDKKVEISSHNHGFSVDSNSLPKGVELTHKNLNDSTCEGLQSTAHNAFSVQYHPESAPGPHDSDYLFDKFVKTLDSAEKGSPA